MSTLKLSTAKQIIEDSKKAIVFFRGQRNMYKQAFNEALKKLPNYYKKHNFYQKLKPYITEEKDISLLKNEDFLTENKGKVKRQEVLKRMEKSVNRAGGWENIYVPN